MLAVIRRAAIRWSMTLSMLVRCVNGSCVGVPFAFAPREQVEVPMLWWLPDDAARGLRVD